MTTVPIARSLLKYGQLKTRSRAVLHVCACVCVYTSIRSHYQRVHGKQMSLANTVQKMMADRELK